jgi:catechol 2,3-dioxygenase-like lactoylglutathione lyase family enzyme
MSTSPVVRYLVTDVDTAVQFYVDQLGAALLERWAPAMAIVELAGLQLWLAGPTASAARAMPDGRTPAPGGWNRLVVTVADLDPLVERLRASGAVFRNEPLSGPGGRQVLVEDPSGNPVELFQPR